MAGEAAAQFHLLDLAVGRESARLTQTPQYLVIVLSDGWSVGGRDLESDAGGYKQRVVVAGCCTKGAGLVAHRSNSGCCAAHIRFGRPNLRPNGVAASPLQAASFREAAIFEFKPDSWAPSVTRVIDEPSKGFGPLDSSFAPGSQEV